MNKKNFIALAICCIFVMNIQSSAQTPINKTNLYLTNAGFDSNFNYGISTTGNVAGDIINNISGWNKDMTATYTVAGTFAYGSGASFNNSGTIPATGYKGSTGGALALSTGWDVSLRYAQNAKLISGKYALVAAYYNVGTATAGSSLLGWSPTIGDETAISTVSSFPLNTWITDTVKFVVQEEANGKIQIGFRAKSGIGSGSNAKILVDFVEILYYGVDKTELAHQITIAENIYADGSGIDANTLLALINSSKAIMADENASMREVTNATNNLQAGTREFQLKNASESNPLSMTHLIVNPSFESSFTGWTNNGMVLQTNTNFPLKNGNNYIEKWVNRGSKVPDANVEQLLTNLPYGRYKLTVAAGNIQQSAAGSTQNNSSKPQTGAYLVANDDSTSIDTIKDRSVNFFVLDKQVKIGFRTKNATGNWVNCDNFRLDYIGLNLNEIAIHVGNKKSFAESLLMSKMQNAAKNELENAIQKAQQATSATPLLLNDLSDAFNQLKSSVNAATVSIDAYRSLQHAIDSATVIHGEGIGIDAGALHASIENSKNVADNLDADLPTIYQATANTNKAIFAYYLANATGTKPTVVTNPFVARGATAVFGRSTISGVLFSKILEHGLCWSTEPNPTILDNRTTKNFSNNGYIYHIDKLQPSTVYYVRAYALTKTYDVGYGEVIKIITIPKGSISYQLNSSVTNAEGHYERIDAAMAEAVNYWNNLTSIKGHKLSVNFNAGTPTAEASYGGYMQFGASSSYQRTGTALHEMDHTIGVGQHTYWYGPSSPLRADGTRGKWLGTRANKVLQFLENDSTAYMTGDAVHLWPASPTRSCLPYGINGAHEDSGSELVYIGNSLLTQALGEDGLPPTGGFTTPSYSFEHNNATKYYIKNEDQSKGRDNAFLVENELGNLVFKTMDTDEAMRNDSAAWVFQFNPVNSYYQIRNVATNKYFSYRSAGVNGIGLKEKATLSAYENFQLQESRIDSEIKSDEKTFKTKGFWIVYPENKLTPNCLMAGSNGATTATTFNITNAATAQRWLLLSPEKLKTYFDTASDVGTLKQNKPRVNIANSKGGLIISANETTGLNHINIYSISGIQLFTISIGNEPCFVPLAPGVYIIGNQKSVVF